MIYRTTIVTAVVLLVLVGCAPDADHTIHARAYLDEKGGIYYDETVHPTALVRAGERVEWVCECAPGIEFSVTEPMVRFDFDGFPGIERGDGWYREALEELASGLQQTSNGEPRRSPEAGVEDIEHPANDPVAAAREFLQALAPALPPRPGPNQARPTLFEGAVPRGFVDADGAIQSHPVRANPGNRLWKFSWKFRLTDDPSVQKEWDPHLISDDF